MSHSFVLIYVYIIVILFICCFIHQKRISEPSFTQTMQLSFAKAS